MKDIKTIFVNGKYETLNMHGVIDLTSKKDIDEINKKRVASHKKSFSFKFGIRENPLGDVIDYITKKTGIKWLVVKLVKECGCEKRRQYFNKWKLYLPYFKIVNQFKAPKNIDIAEHVTYVLGNTKEEYKPIPRNLLKKQKKPCSCGARKND